MSVEQAGIIDGVPFWIMYMPLSQEVLDRKERPMKCPLCGHGWEGGQISRLMMSNGVLFPNSACHQGCIDHEGGPQAAAEKLKGMYDECKAAREKFVPLGWLGAWPG